MNKQMKIDRYYVKKPDLSDQKICKKSEDLVSEIIQFQFKLFKEENITFEEFLKFTNVRELVELSLRRKCSKNAETRLKKIDKYAEKVYKACQIDPSYLAKTKTFLKLQYKPGLPQNYLQAKYSEPYSKIDPVYNSGVEQVADFQKFACTSEKNTSCEEKRKKPGPKSLTLKKATTVTGPIEEETEIKLKSKNEQISAEKTGTISHNVKRKISEFNFPNSESMTKKNKDSIEDPAVLSSDVLKKTCSDNNLPKNPHQFKEQEQNAIVNKKHLKTLEFEKGNRLIMDEIFKMSLNEFKMKTNIAELIYDAKISGIVSIDLDKYVKIIYKRYIRKSIWVENLKLYSQFKNEELQQSANVEEKNKNDILLRDIRFIASKLSSSKISDSGIKDSEKLINDISNKHTKNFDKNQILNPASNSSNIPLQSKNNVWLNSIAEEMMEKIEKSSGSSSSETNNLILVDKEIKNKQLLESKNTQKRLKEDFCEKLNKVSDKDKKKTFDLTQISIKKDVQAQCSNYSDEVRMLSQKKDEVITNEDDEKSVNKLVPLKTTEPNSELIQLEATVSTKLSADENGISKVISKNMDKNFNCLNQNISLQINAESKIGEADTEELDFYNDFGCKSAPLFTRDAFQMTRTLFSRKERKQIVKRMMQNALGNDSDEFVSPFAAERSDDSSDFKSVSSKTHEKFTLGSKLLQNAEFEYKSEVNAHPENNKESKSRNYPSLIQQKVKKEVIKFGGRPFLITDELQKIIENRNKLKKKNQNQRSNE